MGKTSILLFILFVPLFLSSCETMTMSMSALPSSFSTENIMKIHPGMSSDEILVLFGEPKNIKSAVCGGAAIDNPWNCTTWEYGNSPYDNARFTFSGQHGSYILNNFDVDRDLSW